MAIGRPSSVGDVADVRDRRRVLVVRAVREVDARDVRGPASIRPRTRRASTLDGPSVQTIFVRQ